VDIMLTTIEDQDLKFQIKIWMMIITMEMMLDNIPEFAKQTQLTPAMSTQI
jgi:hypothetical protein